ncbi:MAG: hypothetical protein MK289_04645 [Trichodesmium sp. ALOHA_ZT_67]|nr:hypothetical protein [Trichodesmium sp. ALOHA_ZT_67]
MFTSQQVYLLAMNNSVRRISFSKNHSIVPRKKYDSSTYLNIYQSVVRKEHLSREMNRIQERFDQIKEEIAFLDKKIKNEKMILKDQKVEEINEEKESKSSEINEEKKSKPSYQPKINELKNQTSIPVQSKFKTINFGY